VIRRLAVVLSALFVTSALFVPAAVADPSPVTVSIGAGNTDTPVGSPTFTRAENNDGTETLTVDLSVQPGINEDHLCLSDTAFTSRIPPGQCAYSHTNLGGATSDQFVENIGSSYVGKTLYAQLHVATADGQTAFAGWHAGNPFYGNVAIDPVAPGVPAAPLFGSWAPIGMAIVFLGGAGAVAWRRTRRHATAS